ncbi:MAG: DUF255 domain-containing protein [Bacteroidetes bacterium]|nr:DUF255 domain-containing protein [Bacteroidota bacterium]
MIKKILFALGIATIVVIAQSFIDKAMIEKDETAGPVKWYTFEEAVALQKKNPKPIMVDIYTSWCGPCKMMSKNTFGHPIIAKYLNEHYYPVKFDAETRDSVKFNGYVFANKNPEGTPRPVHDFAISILEGKLSYPSVVFLNEDIKKLHTVVGYYKADQFEPYLKFFGSGKYKDTKWEDFLNTFVAETKEPEPATFPGK